MFYVTMQDKLYSIIQYRIRYILYYNVGQFIFYNTKKDQVYSILQCRTRYII